VFNAQCQSGILGLDLKQPWVEVNRWMRGEKDKKAELDLITTTVRESLDRFMRMTKYIETKPPPRKQHADIQTIGWYYVSSAPARPRRRPSGPDQGELYIHLGPPPPFRQDKQVGGSPSGFAWKMTMGEPQFTMEMLRVFHTISSRGSRCIDISDSFFCRVPVSVVSRPLPSVPFALALVLVSICSCIHVQVGPFLATGQVSRSWVLVAL
jgi:hypothetical protein